MSFVDALPPSGYQPDELTMWFTVMSPPFEWIVKRGQGWVMLRVEIPFNDGKLRSVECTIGKYPTYPAYPVDVRINSDLILELGLVNSQPPMIGRVDAHLPSVGKRI